VSLDEILDMGSICSNRQSVFTVFPVGIFLSSFILFGLSLFPCQVQFLSGWGSPRSMGGRSPSESPLVGVRATLRVLFFSVLVGFLGFSFASFVLFDSLLVRCCDRWFALLHFITFVRGDYRDVLWRWKYIF
jgi:hypothetical protein